MIFRRLKTHIEKENWFAVGIDFAIVVIGVFIGIQVANWNETRDARKTEAELIHRLDNEFTTIAKSFDETLESLPVYLDATRDLIRLARGETTMSEGDLKYAALLSNNLGRPPLKSATYQQLVASGDLKLLRNPRLRDALTQYHQSVDRQSFFYPQTIDQIMRLPDFFDLPLETLEELDFPPPKEIIDNIVVDREALKSAEGALEGLLILQFNLHRAAMIQDDLVSEVQSALTEAAS